MTQEAAVWNARAVNLTNLQPLPRNSGTITNSGHTQNNMLHRFRAATRNVVHVGRSVGELLGRGARCPGCERGVNASAKGSCGLGLGRETGEVGDSFRAFSGSAASFRQSYAAQMIAARERIGAVSKDKESAGVSGRAESGRNERKEESAVPSSVDESNAAEAATEIGETSGEERASLGESQSTEAGNASDAEAVHGKLGAAEGLVGASEEGSRLDGSGESSSSAADRDVSGGGSNDEASSTETSPAVEGNVGEEVGVSVSETKRRASPNGRRARVGKSSPPNVKSSSEPSSSSRGKQMKTGTEVRKDVDAEIPKSKVFKETGRLPMRAASEEKRKKEVTKELPATDLLTVKGIGPKTVGNFISEGITSVQDLKNLYKKEFYKKSEGMVALLQTKYGVKQQMWAREIVKHVEEHVENEDPATTEAAGAENTRKKPLTFCVEGNISVGKSTFLRQIVSKTIILKELVDISPEPVEKWQAVGDDRHNILDSFYRDPQRYAYTFQNYVFFTRMLQAQEQPRDRRPLRLMERSVFSDRMVFVRAVHEAKYMSDMEISIYDSWFSPILTAIPTLVPDGFIYLRAKPDTCFNRLKKRGRSEETGVDMDYLMNLHEKHEQWLIPDPSRQGNTHSLKRGFTPEGCPEAIKNDVFSLVNSEVHPLIQGLPALVLDCDPDMDIERDSEKKNFYADKVKTFYDYIKENPPSAGSRHHIIRPYNEGLIDPRSAEAEETIRRYKEEALGHEWAERARATAAA